MEASHYQSTTQCGRKRTPRKAAAGGAGSARRACFTSLTTLVLMVAGAHAEPRRVSSSPPPGSALPRWPHRADPTPMVTRAYLDLAVVLEGGKLKVAKVQKGLFSDARAILPRYAGRFEVKLYVHSLLRDVVRFNFPLTGGLGERRAGQDALSRGLSLGVSAARTTARIPYDDSITGVVIDDTVTRARVTVDLSGVRPRRPPALPLPGPTRSGSFRKKS
jgi:hypothetical protein